MSKYLIRLDDACHTQNRSNWGQIETILDRYNIKPIVAVVPDCKDPELFFDKPLDSFWNLVKSWEIKGWTIGMHGYQHLFVNVEKHYSLVPIHDRTEFAGLPYEEQSTKIKNAWSIFLKKNVKPTIWIAPAHTFDTNTIKALYMFTDIRMVSDCFSLNTFKYKDFIFIPQQLWHFSKMPLGLWTICLHPSNMNSKQIDKVEQWLKNNREYFLNLPKLDFTNRKWFFTERIINNYFWFNKNKMKIFKNMIRIFKFDK